MRPITLLLAFVAGCSDGDGEATDGTDPTVPFVPPIAEDGDGDGHVTEELGGDDCDDTDMFVHPDATEHCDGVDENCNDEIDEDAIDAPVYYEDADGDGFGSPGTEVRSCSEGAPGTATNDDDCDDGNVSLNPDGNEICNGGYDDDCNSTTVETAMIGTVGYASINGAVAAATAGALIELCDGNHLTKGVLVDKDVTITSGNGTRSGSTIDGGIAGAGAMFVVDGGDLTLQSVTVVNADNGAINALNVGGGSITIDDVLFDGNESGGNGGAIQGTTMTITDSDFVDNDATNGGAIFAVAPGIVTMTDVTFDGNSADLDGGAFYTSAFTTLIGVTAIGNSATHNGGAGAAVGNSGTVALVGSTFSGNDAANGGALFMLGASGSADAATVFDGNTATGDPALFFGWAFGGALLVHANGNDVTWSGGLFTGNSTNNFSFSAGGAVVLDASNQFALGGGSIEATGLILDGNATIGSPNLHTGGGVWTAGGPILLADTLTMNNTSDYGGGTSINNSFDDGVVLERVEYRGNSGINAGATDVFDSVATFTDCVIEENSAPAFAALLLDTSTFQSRLEVVSSELGVGATDNTPNDVYINVFPDRTYKFGDDATFVCEIATGVCL